MPSSSGAAKPGATGELSPLSLDDFLQDLHDLHYGETTFAHGGFSLHYKYAGKLQLLAGLSQLVLAGFVSDNVSAWSISPIF